MNRELETLTNSDDTSILRVLLHTIHGLSPVAGNSMDFLAAEDDAEF